MSPNLYKGTGHQKLLYAWKGCTWLAGPERGGERDIHRNIKDLHSYWSVEFTFLPCDMLCPKQSISRRIPLIQSSFAPTEKQRVSTLIWKGEKGGEFLLTCVFYTISVAPSFFMRCTAILKLTLAGGLVADGGPWWNRHVQLYLVKTHPKVRLVSGWFLTTGYVVIREYRDS